MEETPDYVTVLRSPLNKSVMVAIMRWDVRADAYQVFSSCATTANGAAHLATQWARQKGLEVR